MYAIYAYIGVVLGVNVGICGIHGVSGYKFDKEVTSNGSRPWDMGHGSLGS